ncbi:NAD(P)-binding protein [Myriangium duriaei CBS 260.36]|uniref:NAD(P)-binding protein n=1 Tax=Myriangium duriaei CBS 260.36 TaxID=1168546 RepID=A0A9P4MLY5_9PEZI|nr:NAD(P)-binding protein [Myriangium duriaei CBS 260.36]
MSSTKILLLGGHGKIALKLTPLLLARSWHVTSVIRNPDQESELQALAKNKPGKLDVLIESLDDVAAEADAAKVLDKVKPQWVVWAAGAGGKGGAARAYAVDRDAAKAYISASAAASSVRKFLMISYIGSRRGTPPWWNAEDKKAADHVNTEVLPDYYKAKVDADEHLLAVAEKKRRGGDKDWQLINLRPGTLSDDAGTGKVKLGKTSSRGKVSREDVAAVAVALLARDDTRGYFDLLQGDERIEEAVEKVVKEGHDGVQGENLEEIYQRI